jgi:hypothetical protein
VRRAGALLLCAATLGASARASGEDDAGVAAATLTCQPAAAPGRVRCDVEARVAAGETIAWGEVVLLRVAPFASALRGRIGPHAATVREPRVWLWPLAVVAREKGRGTVEGRVRLVVCREGTCAPRSLEMTGDIAVGN